MHNNKNLIIKDSLITKTIDYKDMYNVTIGLNNNTIHTCNFNSLETKEYFLSESELREIILSNLIKVGNTNASC